MPFGVANSTRKISEIKLIQLLVNTEADGCSIEQSGPHIELPAQKTGPEHRSLQA